MNLAGRYLRWRAQEIAAVYLAHTRPHALLLTGSAAQGDCDAYSDIDLIAYYDELPHEERIAQARERLPDTTPRPLMRQEGEGASVLDSFVIAGIECQVVHMPIDRVERDLARVLEEFDLDPALHKALLGLLEGVPLHGEELVCGWQARAADFLDGLAEAMVAHYLDQIVPPWYVQPSLTRRDTVRWQQELLVECTRGVLGALAGLNRHYFSTFQFKRMRQLIELLPLAPVNLPERIEALFAPPQDTAAERAETLVRETVDLIDRHLSQVDTAAIRGLLGKRLQPWSLPPDW